MNRVIKIKNKNVIVKIKSFINAKSIKLLVKADGQVILTKPKRISGLAVDLFLRNKSAWLEKVIEVIDSKKMIAPLNQLKDLKKLKKEARELVKLKIKKFEQFYNLQANRISIRNQTTRWGSCSGRGNLNFNYRLVYLEPELVDYIIVHELCHLQEFNHSSAFWQLVSRTIPEYKLLRKKLKNIKIT